MAGLRDAQLKVILSLEKKGFDKGTKEVKGSLKDLKTNLKDMGKQFGMVAGGVALAGAALYTMGKRGAIVTQTGDSFDYLSQKLGLAPDLLDQLRTASKGTISDMTLMSSTATLLAGTTDEVGKAMGDATPQLLEVAKAANKLNPSLGTTSHMYESLSLGIKRQSPLILDNLGLTIKLGAANEAMAKKLNKSVEALTAEEKQLALLSATLEAGDKLIAQVGGTTESATDAYARLETQTANLTDTFKVMFAEGLEPIIGGLADFFEAQRPATEAYKEMHDAMAAGIITETELIELDRQQAEGKISLTDIIGILDKKASDHNATLDQTNFLLYTTTEGLRIAREEYILAAEATGIAEGATWNFASAVGGAQGALEGLSGVLQGQYMNALKAATSGVYELERMKLVLKLQTEDLSQKEIEHALNMLDSIGRMGTLTQAVKDGEVSQRDLRGAIADGLVTQDEFNRMMGITAIEVDKAEQEVWQLKGAVDSLQDKTITITTNYREIYNRDLGRRPPTGGDGGTTPPPYVPPPTPYVPPPPRRDPYIPVQRGTNFIVPPGYPNDSFYYPMALTSGEHLEVTPRAEVGRENRQSNVTNYNYLTIQTNAPVESDVPDLLLLRAWASG